jgi:DNA-binding MarR family transcriptional regulator
MRDLVSHDRMPSAFLVYLWLWRQTKGRRRTRLGASLQTIATETGLSKSSVQNAVRLLSARRLISVTRRGPTEAPLYTVHEPWAR